jgi:hypothetical protein
MYQFSKQSEQRLQTCHADLQKVLHGAIKLINFTIIEAERNEPAQNAAFAAGKSKLKYPHSKHNHRPSLAVDIAPFPLDWNNRERFALLAGVMLATAASLGIRLRWGGDWNANGEMSDNKFDDLPHFELI